LEFDDVNGKLKYSKKVDVLQKFLSVGSINKFQEYFEDSLILQLRWDDSIDLTEREEYIFDKKITFISLVRKYFGKKSRELIQKIKNIIK